MERIREEIDNKYKWDLTKIIKDEKEFDEIYDNVIKFANQINEFQGKIAKDKDTFKSYLELDEKMNRSFMKIYLYANLLCDTDTNNPKGQNLKMRVEKLNEEINRLTYFTAAEILRTPMEVYMEYLSKDEELKKYEFCLLELFRHASHTLSDKEEEIIAYASNAMGTGSDAFYNLDNSDIDLGTIEDEDRCEQKLTHSNYIKFMKSKNRDVRKNAFEKLYSYFSSHKNTLASCLRGNVKENHFISRVRKYNSPLEQSLYADAIDVKVYTNLIDVTHKNLDKVYKYMDLKKKALKLDELHMYDMYVDLIENKKDDVPYEEGQKIVLEALKPLGEQYINDLKQAFTDGWIDVYPSKGKKSGAYQWGCYDIKPHVLLNYENTIEDVSTMAHELGHAMHSYYSDKNQDYIYHDYPIFLAEIASTVNEILLDEYLYKNAKTKEEKILYITNFLEKTKATIYRQTMFAEFEMIIHDKEENGIPLTEEEFSKTYYDLNKLYYGDNVVSDELIKYEWSRIPHFYTSFYVYKYATGLAAAIAIASKILEGNEEARCAYLEFLSSGSSDYPLNILKKAGVDMTKTESIQAAFDMFDKKLEELKSLL